MIIHHHLLLPLLQPPCQWLPTSWPYSLMLTEGVVRREVTVATLAQHNTKITDETKNEQNFCLFSFHLVSVCSVEVFTLLWLRYNYLLALLMTHYITSCLVFPTMVVLCYHKVSMARDTDKGCLVQAHLSTM